MNYNDEHKVPSLFRRVLSVWSRHVKVYNSSFFSNAFPPFFEPLIFLAGLGIGLGTFVKTMDNMSYVLFLASGLIVTSAMFTSAYECTFGTFIRLEFDRVYDGMLGAPISPKNLIAGEIIFAGTKGFFFSFAVLVVIWIAGVVNYPLSVLATLVGFVTGIMFGTLSMFVTSFVKNINHFNFYFTGLLSPMFFFSGVVFPLDNLPKALRYVAEVIPLTHLVRMSRAFCVPGRLNTYFLYDLAYCAIFIIITGWLAVNGVKKRMID